MTDTTSSANELDQSRNDERYDINRGTPITVPKIDFTNTGNIKLVEVRKGFGFGSVGGIGPAARDDEEQVQTEA